MPLKRVGDLQIDEDLEWERGEWKFERIGWAVMALIILAALIGLFGRGPLSSQTAGDENGEFWVEYERFVRYNSPEEVHVYVDPQFVQDDQLRLVIEGDFPHSNQLNEISPTPDSVELSSGKQIYVWQTSDATGPMHIIFQYNAIQLFNQNSRFGPEQADALEISQFVFP
jgi:hypothetical protein